MAESALRDARWSAKVSRYLNGRVPSVIGRLGVTDTAIVFVPSRWARVAAAGLSPYRPDWKEVSLDPLVIGLHKVVKIDLARPAFFAGLPAAPGIVHVAVTDEGDAFFAPRGQIQVDEILAALRRAVETTQDGERSGDPTCP